jgi:hypothetical protein
MTAWQAPTYPPVLAIVVAALIVLGYAASLWWLLRRESVAVVLALLALCGVSLSLRLVYTTDFPAGFNEDEPKILRCAYEDLMGGSLLGEGCTELPVLLNALFQAQLVPVLGPGRWAIRSYSLVTSVLATAVAFAAARALTFAVIPSFAVGAFIAVLPWSLFFGRVSIGGEMVFHQLLLLAALARLVWAERAGWPEVGIGSLGLGLLLYDYFCGFAMLGMPLVAAAFARGRRMLCLAMLVVAVAGWIPYMRAHPPSPERGMVSRLNPRLFSEPREVLEEKAQFALRALREPIGEDWALTIRSAAMHPPLILALAALGAVLAARRGPFLVAGFLGGLLPAMVSWGDTISPHRMLMAFPFIALAAGAAVNAIRWRGWCLLVTVSVVVVVAVQSVGLYFSPSFWPPKSRATFDWELTSLAEAIPIPTQVRVVYMSHASYFIGPRTLVDRNYEPLSVENWLPPSNAPVMYAFSQHAGPLQAFYEHLFGGERVHPFGRAFLVNLEAADWSWVRTHGWMYEARCGDQTWRGQVPALFHLYLTFAAIRCDGPVTHRWRGRWLGPPTTLRLRFNGDANIETSTGPAVQKKAAEGYGSFSVQPDSAVTITVTRPGLDGAVSATLVENSPFGERVPPWEWVTPN